MTGFTILISPIDCCVRINHKPVSLLNGWYSVIDILIVTASISKLCIPGCLLIHLNINIQHRHHTSTVFLNWASTMWNNVTPTFTVCLFFVGSQKKKILFSLKKLFLKMSLWRNGFLMNSARFPHLEYLGAFSDFGRVRDIKFFFILFVIENSDEA